MVLPTMAGRPRPRVAAPQIRMRRQKAKRKAEAAAGVAAGGAANNAPVLFHSLYFFIRFASAGAGSARSFSTAATVACHSFSWRLVSNG